MEERVALGLCDIFAGLVLVGVCIPLVLEKIPPNRFCGFRIPQAFRSEEAWYDINRYGGWQMIGWSTPLFITGTLKMVFPWDEWVMSDLVGWSILLGPILVCSLVPIVITLAYAIFRDPQL